MKLDKTVGRVVPRARGGMYRAHSLNNKMTLTWESTYAIALELRRQHPDVNLDDVTLGQIYKWTLGLPEFEDDPSLANDDILYAIYQDWFEENIHGQ